jgi:hypothetical protein
MPEDGDEFVTLYHFTDLDGFAGILQDGAFVDATATYMTGERLTGVWFADRPLDENEGARGTHGFAIEIPESRLVDYEVVEDRKPYREWLIPATLANEYGPPTPVDLGAALRMMYQVLDSQLGARLGTLARKVRDLEVSAAYSLSEQDLRLALIERHLRLPNGF